ncbi:MAG: hypothetical protein J6A52_00540 [Bacilli bacterium]|nr:hypothetical protein [Bacilli bacterium]
MDLNCKLVKKTFNAKDTGEVREYYSLVFNLADGSTIEQTVKSDKAKILIMSYNLSKK